VSLNVDVLMGGAVASSYLREATTKIPIVFMFVPDPVGMKFVQSIGRPGGNITGLSNFGRDVAGKRLQLLQEIVPGLSRVALLINSDQSTTRIFVEVMQPTAEQLGLVLQTFDARSLEEIGPAFDAMVRARMQAVTPVQGGLFFQARALIPKLAIARRLPMLAYSGKRLSMAPSCLTQLIRLRCVVDRRFTPTKYSRARNRGTYRSSSRPNLNY